MRIAVVGGGISGNTIAWLLAGEHEVHLFEANDYLGGHTNTVEVAAYGGRYAADTGFMVFNERTYPNFCRLLKTLGVAAQDSDMSFSVCCERTGLEYQGSSLNGLFAQRRNLLNLPFLGMLREILRFNRTALAALEGPDELTLGQYLAQRGYGRRFINHYLVPMASAIWSARPESLLDFPARFLIGFFRNHGLLQVRDRPQWKTIAGGARRYVEALVAPLRGRIRLNCRVGNVTRFADRVLVQPVGGEPEAFDQVVMASHADQTLSMLTDADNLEREILAAFPYQPNETVVHTDCRLLPRLKRAWASWNYHIPRAENRPVAVTYDLSRLQRIPSPEPILATLNHVEQIDREKTLWRMTYHHPAYTLASINAQKRHAEINGRRRTYFCGAYWGYGFHEDGVNSALSVAKYFGRGLD